MTVISKLAVVAATVCGAAAFIWRIRQGKNIEYEVLANDMTFTSECCESKLSQETESDEDEEEEEHIIEDYMRIPGKAIGAVIGKYGKNLRAIESDVKVDCSVVSFSKDDLYNSRRGKLEETRGWGSMKKEAEEDWFGEDAQRTDAEDVKFLVVRADSQKKIELVRLRVAEIIRKSIRQWYEAELDIERSAMGYVIGKNGRNVKTMSAKFGVTIKLLPYENNANKVKVTIRGIDEYGVKEAELCMRNAWMNVSGHEAKKYNEKRRSGIVRSHGLTADVHQEIQALRNAKAALETEDDEAW